MAWSRRRSAPAEAADRILVADLRRASARYPDDPRVPDLPARTLAEQRALSLVLGGRRQARRTEDRKTIRHPDVGEIAIDCDVVTDGDSDLQIVAYVAAPGSEDEQKLRRVTNPMPGAASCGPTVRRGDSVSEVRARS
ncbi:hypothetical protein ACQP1K_18590 [Sphaerimonospora sp. CA-214678]|uniref:MmyB family transcriptional regulator n=1 Tax=Sphaerimonospora sp. CA-214678 TaxID=3240029 RepID=UPI003D90CEE7